MGPSTEVAAFRAAMQDVLRSFGALNAEQTPCGQTLPIGHAHALQVLLHAQGEVDQKHLGAALGVDKSNVARLCARMAARGHIEVHSGTEDGRRRLLVLTARGKELAAAVDASSRRKFSQILNNIPEDHRGNLLRILSVLADACRRDAFVSAQQDAGDGAEFSANASVREAGDGAEFLANASASNSKKNTKEEEL